MKQISDRHKKRLKEYNEHLKSLPDEVRCAACGGLSDSDYLDKHHPAGRRKSSYFFVFLLHPECHRRVHDNPKWAEQNGLLWQGRNSKILTKSDMRELVSSAPFPPRYALKQYE